MTLGPTQLVQPDPHQQGAQGISPCDHRTVRLSALCSAVHNGRWHTCCSSLWFGGMLPLSRKLRLFLDLSGNPLRRFAFLHAHAFPQSPCDFALSPAVTLATYSPQYIHERPETTAAARRSRVSSRARRSKHQARRTSSMQPRRSLDSSTQASIPRRQGSDWQTHFNG